MVEADNEGNLAPNALIYSTEGMTIERATELLRGKTGTCVTVTVIPAK